MVPGIFQDWNAPRDIIHLTSKDLRKWKYESTLKLASDRVIDACVIRAAGRHMAHVVQERARQDGSMYYADSPDLYQWRTKGVAIPGSRGEGPKVFGWRGRYWMIADVWDGLAVYSSSDCLKWERQANNVLKEPGVVPTDRSKGSHADVVVSGDRAFIFYFVHQRGADAEGKDAGWNRRTVIQVAELEYRDGAIVCDRNKPVPIALVPPRPTSQR